MVEDNILDWFRNEFVPTASDHTIAALIFLYDKYARELKEDEDSRQFLIEKTREYLNTPVDRANM